MSPPHMAGSAVGGKSTDKTPFLMNRLSDIHVSRRTPLYYGIPS